MKYIILQGTAITDQESFFEEIHKFLGGSGNNLDALDDILSGGLSSDYDEDEEIVVTWKSSDLSQAKMAEYFDKIVEVFQNHPNIELRLE